MEKTETQAIVADDDKNESIIVYTDGSCRGNPGGGGWSAVILAGGEEKRLAGGEADTTNNRMELTAAIQALSAIEARADWREHPINVSIDSEYVRQGITVWINKWKTNKWRTSDKKPVKNQDLWKILDELNNSHKVTWTWVRGHTGNVYNELCDRLAQAESEKFTEKL